MKTEIHRIKLSASIHPKSFVDIEPIMGKRALVKFTPDKAVIGRLGRNSFKNEILCLTTGNSETEELYGKLFFEVSSVYSIQIILDV